MYTLNNFFLGKSDGKKEAIYQPDFENYFYDHEGIYEKTLSKENYLVLGRKGTGKSLLAELIKKKSNKDALWFCNVRSYKEFKFHELIHLKNNDIRPNEYISIWEWVILIELGKLCLENQAFHPSENWNKLNDFICNNFYSLKIDADKIVEITKQNKLTASILRLGGESGVSEKYNKGSYLNYLDDLRNIVFTLLEEVNCKFTLIYDELDDKFRNDDLYKDSIISLVKATDKINLEMINRNIDCKVMLFLRTDIFYLLNDPDLNKIKEDNSVTLDWGTYADKNSPLFDLILQKISVSVPELKNKSRDTLFSELFPQKINGVSPERFLLGRSFFRPRDVITYLNYIIEKYPHTMYFGSKGFKELERKYSSYFYQEIRNELSGHISNEEIDEGTLLLKQFNKFIFTYDEINEYYSHNKKLYPNVNLEETLKVFFNFGIIGNKWYNEYRKKDYYLWSYRDNKPIIDYNKEFVIHLGLRKELSL